MFIIINETIIKTDFLKNNSSSTGWDLALVSVNYLFGTIILIACLIGYPFMRLGLLSLRKPNTVLLAYSYDTILAACAFYAVGYAFSTSSSNKLNAYFNETIIKQNESVHINSSFTTRTISKVFKKYFEIAVPSNAFIAFNPKNTQDVSLEVRSITFLRLIYMVTFSTIAGTATVGRITLIASVLTRICSMGFLLPVIFYWTHNENGWLRKGINVPDLTARFIFSDSGSASLHLASGTICLIGCIFYSFRRSVYSETTDNPPVYHTAILCLGTIFVFLNIFCITIVDLYINECHLLDFLENENIKFSDLSRKCNFTEFLNKILNSVFKMIVSILSATTLHICLIKVRRLNLTEYQIYQHISIIIIGSFVAILPNLLATDFFKSFIFGVFVAFLFFWWNKLMKRFKLKDYEQITFMHFASSLFGVLCQPFMSIINYKTLPILKILIYSLLWQLAGVLAIITLCSFSTGILFYLLYRLNFLLTDLKDAESKKFFTWYDLHFSDIKCFQLNEDRKLNIDNRNEANLTKTKLQEEIQMYTIMKDSIDESKSEFKTIVAKSIGLNARYNILLDFFDNNIEVLSKILVNNNHVKIRKCHDLYFQSSVDEVKQSFSQDKAISRSNKKSNLYRVNNMFDADFFILHSLNLNDPFCNDSLMIIVNTDDCLHYTEDIIKFLETKNRVKVKCIHNTSTSYQDNNVIALSMKFSISSISNQFLSKGLELNLRNTLVKLVPRKYKRENPKYIV